MVWARIVNALRPVTDLPLDVHLMIVEPEQRVPDFIKAGADIVSVHCEQSSTIHLHRTVNQIKSLGAKAGVVLNPATPLSTIEYVLDVVDLVLIMSVNPGFGGQSFIESQVKISDLRRMRVEKGVNPWIEVDGGVTPANAYKVIEVGANALVAGSAVFEAKDYAEAIKGGSRDGMVTLENRVWGLERVVEDMARNLSLSMNNLKTSYYMNAFEESSGRSLSKYNGFSDYKSRGSSWNHQTHTQNTQIVLRKGVGPVRFGEGPSARRVWKASKNEATLEAIRGAAPEVVGTQV